MEHAERFASFVTAGDIVVRRRVREIGVAGARRAIVLALDQQRGALLACATDSPGRYARAEVGFVDPPLVLTAHGRGFFLEALNRRGQLLLPRLFRALAEVAVVVELDRSATRVSGRVPASSAPFTEEERTRQPSVFTVVRALAAVFAVPGHVDDRLGFYGAFGYDLGFQLEPIALKRERPAGQRDLVLYLPDELTVIDHRRGRAFCYDYDFAVDWASTEGLPREGQPRALKAAAVSVQRDHQPGEFAQLVKTAQAAFARGDLFEVTPGQSFHEPCAVAPSELFARLITRNPTPYAFLVNLGEGEHLVGASPEMFVRVTGDRVETAPIAGTIARGVDALADATQVGRLLASEKDEAELTMCTDVDRNDKSRVCVPGSVRVIGRRQIEMYARLIHTVDHVEGRLRPGFDALDAFLTHAWAVTVTGAPKTWAMQFIEDHERSPRGFYGGAVGRVGFDGTLDTGLILRTVHLRDGMAEVRAGATLLHESDPAEEERETELKASALLDAIRRPDTPALVEVCGAGVGAGRRVLLVDHQDSFVHTLANYLRQTGAEVTTLRAGFAESRLAEVAPDLMVLSPGPGTPADFGLGRTIALAQARRLPIFGVCLGLQGLVEYFGGSLDQLARPAHGRPSRVRVLQGDGLFTGMPAEFHAGRYHSLHAQRATLPTELRITAETEDGVIMAIEHTTLAVTAVQFHPESILTAQDDLGLRLLSNVVAAA